ncbi:hypothetical protein H4R19_000814 [Coemansia spiralis]|nr:hypothetical protein H4R19_000814 [Coemansia spiralis]
MRVLVILAVLLACAAAAPVVLVVRSEPGVKHSNTNSGSEKEGTLEDSSSSGGNIITNPEGNTVTKVNQNTDVHDNAIEDAVVNTAQGGTGKTVDGNSNKVTRRADTKEGSLDSGANADGAKVTNPQNNELSQTNQNADIAGNTFKDPTFNGVTNTKGPAMAGNGNLLASTTNEPGTIQFNDNGFMDKAMAST